MSNLTQRAMAFSMRAHGEQPRKYTAEPYWKHCAEVAALVATAPGATEEMVAAAWLHDTVEDTETTLDTIKGLFGEEVARLVKGLTDVSVPEDGNRKARKAIDRKHLQGTCGHTHTIKMADLISNTSSILTHDRGFGRIYLAEKRLLLEEVTRGDPTLTRMAWEILEEGERELGIIPPRG